MVARKRATELRLHRCGVNMQSVEIGGGGYLCVADAHWTDPLDASHAAIGNGQRWNPPGMPCLYLNHDRQTVEANLRLRFGPFPYARFLDPVTSPVILEVELPPGSAADAYTPQGISAVGLPSTYPLDGKGQPVPHQQCQPIGRAAFDAGMNGVDCRSAATGGNREIAWFPRDQDARILTRHTLDAWRGTDPTAR